MRLITTFVLIVLLVLLVLLRLYFSRRFAYAALSSIARSAKEEAPFHLSSLIIHHSPAPPATVASIGVPITPPQARNYRPDCLR